MRVVAALIALAFLASACGADGTTAPATSRPQLTIVGSAPLQIAGRGFEPHERVKLLVTAGRLQTTSVVATRAGRFLVRLAVAGGRCQSATVQALGSRGSRAMVDLAAPDCAPVDES